MSPPGWISRFLHGTDGGTSRSTEKLHSFAKLVPGKLGGTGTSFSNGEFTGAVDGLRTVRIDVRSVKGRKRRSLVSVDTRLRRSCGAEFAAEAPGPNSALCTTPALPRSAIGFKSAPRHGLA